MQREIINWKKLYISTIQINSWLVITWLDFTSLEETKSSYFAIISSLWRSMLRDWRFLWSMERLVRRRDSISFLTLEMAMRLIVSYFPELETHQSIFLTLMWSSKLPLIVAQGGKKPRDLAVFFDQISLQRSKLLATLNLSMLTFILSWVKTQKRWSLLTKGNNISSTKAFISRLLRSFHSCAKRGLRIMPTHWSWARRKSRETWWTASSRTRNRGHGHRGHQQARKGSR